MCAAFHGEVLLFVTESSFTIITFHSMFVNVYSKQHEKLLIWNRCLEKRLPCQLQKYNVLIKWIDFQMNTISSLRMIVRLEVCSRCMKCENQILSPTIYNAIMCSFRGNGGKRQWRAENIPIHWIQFWTSMYLIAAQKYQHKMVRTSDVNWYENWWCFSICCINDNLPGGDVSAISMDL